MEVERRIDSESSIVWTTIRGPVTLRDMCQQFDVIHETGNQQFCGIIDVREAEPHFSAKDLPVLAAHGRSLFGSGGMSPRAIVVNDGDLLTFGLSRLLAKLIAPWVTLRVFDNIHGAVAYITAMVESKREDGPPRVGPEG